MMRQTPHSPPHPPQHRGGHICRSQVPLPARQADPAHHVAPTPPPQQQQQHRPSRHLADATSPAADSPPQRTAQGHVAPNPQWTATTTGRRVTLRTYAENTNSQSRTSSPPPDTPNPPTDDAAPETNPPPWRHCDPSGVPLTYTALRQRIRRRYHPQRRLPHHYQHHPTRHTGKRETLPASAAAS